MGNLSMILNPPVLFSVPHRVMFFAGSIQLVLTLLFWCIELVGRYTSLWSPLEMIIPGVWVHTFLMVYCLYPFLMFGFLMTTYPRWLNTCPVPPAFYISAFAVMSAGCLLFYPALFISRGLLIMAVLLVLSGWAIGIIALFRVYLRPQKNRTPYESILLCLLILGLLSGISSLVWLITYNSLFYQLTLTGGFWLFLTPLIITVSHRMIPFFNSTVLENYTMLRPAWSLPLMGICLLGHFFCTLLGFTKWLFLFDLPLALATGYLAYLWQFHRSFKTPLLAMLHIAFLWLPVGLVLYVVQSLVLTITGDIILGKAPIHALGIGFITSMSLAMATRVSLGHSGRPLIPSSLTMTCFWLLQLVAVLRVVGELPILGFDMMNHWILAAGILWVMTLLVWVWIYVPIYLKPRVDGKPG
jgi:uncharacterized protein involved in response to NO